MCVYVCKCFRAVQHNAHTPPSTPLSVFEMRVGWPPYHGWEQQHCSHPLSHTTHAQFCSHTTLHQHHTLSVNTIIIIHTHTYSSRSQHSRCAPSKKACSSTQQQHRSSASLTCSLTHNTTAASGKQCSAAAVRADPCCFSVLLRSHTKANKEVFAVCSLFD